MVKAHAHLWQMTGQPALLPASALGTKGRAAGRQNLHRPAFNGRWVGVKVQENSMLMVATVRLQITSNSGAADAVNTPTG